MRPNDLLKIANSHGIAIYCPLYYNNMQETRSYICYLPEEANGRRSSAKDRAEMVEGSAKDSERRSTTFAAAT